MKILSINKNTKTCLNSTVLNNSSNQVIHSLFNLSKFNMNLKDAKKHRKRKFSTKFY